MRYQTYFGVPKSDTTVRSSISANTVPPLNPQIAANVSRLKICFANGSTTLKFYLAFGTNEGSSTDYTICLNPGDYFEDTLSIDAISIVSNGTSLTDFLYITEMS